MTEDGEQESGCRALPTNRGVPPTPPDDERELLVGRNASNASRAPDADGPRERDHTATTTAITPDWSGRAASTARIVIGTAPLTRSMTQLSIVEVDETGESHKELARHRRGVRTGTVRRGDLAIDGAPPYAGGVISRSNGRDAGFGRQ
jgi:hypothetical protein